ncbi:uncharacterized, partial [Tachysurus ichikawai]
KIFGALVKEPLRHIKSDNPMSSALSGIHELADTHDRLELL